MRIAVIGPNYPYKGGIAHYSALMVRQLRKNSRVQFYSFSRPYPAAIFAGSQLDNSQKPIKERSNTELDWARPKSWQMVAKKIITAKTQVVIIPWWSVFFAPLTFSITRRLKVAGIKVVFLCHNTVDHDSTWWKNCLARQVLSWGDGYLCQSKCDYRQLKKWFPLDKIERIQHPIYEIFNNRSLTKTQAKRKLGIKGKVILFFGHVRAYKGLPTLIRAISAVKVEGGVKLLVAGEFWEKEEKYRALIRELKLESQIQLINRYIPNEEVATYFAAADCVALPYLSGSGTGVGQIAAAFGKPVVATNVGDLPELVQTVGGELVRPGRVDGLAKAITRVLAKPQVKKLAHKNNWGQIGRVVQKIIHDTPLVVLTGTYSSQNKGDAAMQTATVESLRKLYPKAKIYINTPFPQIDKGVYPGVEILPSSRRNLIIGTWRVGLSYLYQKLFGLGYKFPWLLSSYEQQIFARANLIIDLSGDTITEDYGPHVTYSHLLPIWQGLALAKPVFVCAQSMGPFTITKRLVLWTLKRVRELTVREEITKEYLDKLGLGSQVKLTGDMAFLLSRAAEKRKKEILLQEHIRWNKPQKVLGVSVSTLVLDKQPRLARIMAETLDLMIERHKYRVLFVAHVTGPNRGKDDRLAAQQVHDLMRHKIEVRVMQGDYRPAEIKAVIGSCKLFMGARMHANIAAVSAGVPTLALGYSHKTKGVIGRMGLNKSVIGVEEATKDRLLQSLEVLDQESAKIRKLLSVKAVRMKRHASGNLYLFKELIEK